MRKLSVFGFAFLAIVVSPFTSAQPASAPAGARLKAVITEVVGTVLVRKAPAGALELCTVGMQLDEGAEIQTYPKTHAAFFIEPDQTIQVARSTTISILRAVKENNVVKMNLGLDHGRALITISDPGITHQADVRTPNSTLAVRGTVFYVISERGFPDQGISLTGRVEMTSMLAKKQIAIGGKGTGVAVASDGKGAAENNLLRSITDPSAKNARTPNETNLVATVLSRGGTVEVDRGTGIPIVRNTKPLTDAELIPRLPGGLNFVLRWTGNANLDLGVGTPSSTGGGGFIYPAASLNVARSGGRTNFDDRGGPSGGTEICYWPEGSKFPRGLYGLGVLHISGKTANIQLDAFLNGKRISLFDGTRFVTTFRDTVIPKGSTIAIAPIGATIPVIPNVRQLKSVKIDQAANGKAQPNKR